MTSFVYFHGKQATIFICKNFAKSRIKSEIRLNMGRSKSDKVIKLSQKCRNTASGKGKAPSPKKLR